MIIEQIYTGCLAHGAYYIESNGEAAIVDPLREVEPYIAKAKANNASIKYVFETHFHADFVSGHVDLKSKTGAAIVYGPNAACQFDCVSAKDNEEFKLGNIVIRVLHTPGHTMESSCFLLIDETGKEKALFSGDTLFIGDVGRPDLAQKIKAELTEDKLAGYLYDSLRNKIMPLADDIIVYPAHGAGSACGKNMSKETTDTLSHQKMVNYALRQDMTKEQFKKEVLTGLVAPPSYFPLNVLMNIQGYESIDTVLERGKHALSITEFETALKTTDAIILDTRAPQLFAKAFIPTSINIGIDGNFATWVGTLITDIKQEILLIADEGREAEIITRLARVGYDHCIGYLQGGFTSWQNAGKPTESILSITPEELASIAKNTNTTIVDVRKKSEYDSEHIIGVENAPLDFINDSMLGIDKTKTTYIHCAGGYRSMVFASILKGRGYDNLVDIKGGFKAIKDSNLFSLTNYVCPSTLL
jgi:glyoxylase-like metal-dependent hydrolase (beta-lactamase superfamily II)/rhodanese-related sulfurtransferase